MSQLTMITIYELVDDVCCRDFNNITGKLTPENKNKFVDEIYNDLMSGDNIEEITEQQIYDYVSEVIAKAVFKYLENIVDTIKNP